MNFTIVRWRSKEVRSGYLKTLPLLPLPTLPLAQLELSINVRLLSMLIPVAASTDALGPATKRITKEELKVFSGFCPGDGVDRLGMGL